MSSANDKIEREESRIDISTVDSDVKQALMDIGDRVQRDADECDSEGNPLPNAEDNDEDRQPRHGPGNDPRRHNGQRRQAYSPSHHARGSGKKTSRQQESKDSKSKAVKKKKKKKHALGSDGVRSLVEQCESRRRRFKEVLIRVQRIEQNSRRKARENTASQPILLNGVRRVLMQDRMQRTLQVKLDQIVSKQNDLKAILLTLNERLTESVGEMVKRDEEQKQHKLRRKSRGRRSRQPRSSDASGGTPRRSARHSQASHDSEDVGTTTLTPLEDALQHDFGGVDDDNSAVVAEDEMEESRTGNSVAPSTYDGMVGTEDFPAAQDSNDSGDDDDGDDVWDGDHDEDDGDSDGGDVGEDGQRRKNHQENYADDDNNGNDGGGGGGGSSSSSSNVLIGQLELGNNKNRKPGEHTRSGGSARLSPSSVGSLPNLEFSKPLRKTPSPDCGTDEEGGGHVRRISSDSVDLVDPDHRRLFSVLRSESGESGNELSSSSEKGQLSKRDKT